MDDELKGREVEALEKLADGLSRMQSDLEKVASYVREKEHREEEKARKRAERYRVKTDAEVDKEACELLEGMLMKVAEEHDGDE